ncbi:hypothetical protein C0J52_23831 [Blattella germanica]|nr:hypothetical protein C0J52_23831 [Blattella germanica]
MSSKPKRSRKQYSKFLPAWTFEYLTVQLGHTSAQCLVCKGLVVCKKFNIKRHYEFCHGSQYDSIIMEERQQLVKDLTKNFIADNNSNNRRTSEEREKEAPGLSKGQVSQLSQAIEALQKICEQNNVLNEFQTFGQLVSTQLEQLPLKDAIELETEIIGLIIAKRMKLFKTEENAGTMICDK